jgi:hypothetical protein
MKAQFSVGLRQRLRRQDLDGDDPAEPRIAGAIDHTHPPLAELLEDFAVRDGASNHGPTPLRTKLKEATPNLAGQCLLGIQLKK